MREMHSRVAQDMGMFHHPIHIAIKQDSIDLVIFEINLKKEINCFVFLLDNWPFSRRRSM
jgi:hypothetical protein